MISNNILACPLDCYDACEVLFRDNKFRPSATHKVTNSKLCSNFARLVSEKNLAIPKYKNNIIFLDKAKEILVEKLKSSNPSNTLFYKGSGNMGVMQNSTKIFFNQYGTIFADGSLCDANGEDGIIKSRAKVVNPPLDNLLKSDLIVVWGRNLSVTSPHIYKLVKDKEFIVIDPIKTQIAKESLLHLQIKPKSDYLLALLLTRFAYMEEFEDLEFIRKFTKNSDVFHDISKSKPINEYLLKCGITLKDIGDFFYNIRDKKVSFLIGIGVQKYFEGSQIIRTIEGFCATLGAYNKDVGGVWYLSDSLYGYDNPFKIKAKYKKPISTVFENSYDLIFIQGANPIISAPNKTEVEKSLKNSFVVFFGTTLNESSVYADLIIPSKQFFEKNDVRLSYAHDEIIFSNSVISSQNSISEYELSKYLHEEFGFDSLEDESYYLGKFRKKYDENKKIEEFRFIENIEIKELKKDENEYYLLSAKSKDSINSQFELKDYIYINSKSKFSDGDRVSVSSVNGSATFTVKLDDDIKEDCVLIYTGTKELNRLTSSAVSENHNGAIYAEVVVKIDL